MSPTPESFWVVEGQVLAGKYPGAKFDRAAETKIDALLAAGVRTFVDLTEDDELLPYAHLLPEGVAHFRVGVEDVTCPARAQVREALDMIDAGLENGIVYVHCRGGCGRTGVIVGAYLVRHGQASVRALERVHALTRALWDKPCPETREQIAMVETWREGE
jgi:protein-tyrosine phosphatase